MDADVVGVVAGARVIRWPGVQRSRSAEVFVRAIEIGEVPVPYCPALTEDLYAAYRLWLAPLKADSIAAFTSTFVRHGTNVEHAVVRVALSYEDAPEQRRILLMGERPSDGRNLAARRRRWMRRSVRDFRYALQAWQWRLGEASDRSVSHDPGPSPAERPCEVNDLPRLATQATVPARIRDARDVRDAGPRDADPQGARTRRAYARAYRLFPRLHHQKIEREKEKGERGSSIVGHGMATILANEAFTGPSWPSVPAGNSDPVAVSVAPRSRGVNW